MTKYCSFDECGLVLTNKNAKGLCSGHYGQMRRGEELHPVHRPNVTAWILAQETVANLFNTTSSNVQAIVSGRSWKHLDG